MSERLLYSNAEAKEILLAMQQAGNEAEPASQRVPDEFHKICRGVRAGLCATGSDTGWPDYPVIRSVSGQLLSLRAFPMGDPRGEDNPTHIMVLVERIAERRNPDIRKARERFRLSRREMEVLGHVCQGLPNKTISEKMFISEYTVKDHIKNIMKKMDVGSRNEIIAALQ